MTREEIYLTFERKLEEYADMIMLQDREHTEIVKGELTSLLLEAMRSKGQQ
jgi:hypothetical protein